MDKNSIFITAQKLKRLGVNHVINKDDSITLNGTSFSNWKLFLTIIFPVTFFILSIIILAILINDQVSFPRIVIALPIAALVLLISGISNYIRIKKYSKISVRINKGFIQLSDKHGAQLKLYRDNIKTIRIEVEENYSDSVADLYVVDKNNKNYLLLSILDCKSKYLKDDVEYIRKTIIMILES
jgi:hypothetical protein